MLEEAHKGLEAMTVACGAVKAQAWAKRSGACIKCKISWRG
jgi:hypothetical protein